MTSGELQLFALILSCMGIIVIPLAVMFYRGIVKWTKVEARLEELAGDLKQIVADKDRTHSEMLHQMTEDRKVTDRRLRWLEENLWKRGNARPT